MLIYNNILFKKFNGVESLDKLPISVTTEWLGIDGHRLSN